jgi:hypothetical protein
MVNPAVLVRFQSNSLVNSGAERPELGDLRAVKAGYTLYLADGFYSNSAQPTQLKPWTWIVYLALSHNAFPGSGFFLSPIPAPIIVSFIY